MKRLSLLIPALVVVLVVTGCVRPPESKIQQAKTAYQAAEAAGAPTYAPEAWAKAKQAMDRLNQELAAQGKKFFLLRNYNTAGKLADEAAKAADQAKSEAETNKTQLRNEVTKLIADLKSALQSARNQLSRLPRTTKADVPALRSLLNAASQQLDQAQSDLNAGRLDSAMAAASDARKNIQAVLRAIELATGPPPSKKR